MKKLSDLSVSIIDVQREFCVHSNAYLQDELLDILKTALYCHIHIFSLYDTVIEAFQDAIKN